MNLNAQVARGLKWQSISILGKQGLSFVVFTTLARLLDPASFGLFGLVGVYLGFVNIFADQGIGAALIQRQNLTQSHLDTAFWFNCISAVILCLGTIILADPVSRLLGEPQLVPLLRWSSLALVFGACSSIQANLFIKEMDFRQPVIRTLVSNAIGGGVGVFMALAGCGVWALVGHQLSCAFVGAVFLWSVSKYTPSPRFSWEHLRDLLGVSSSVFASGLLWYVTSRVDHIVIGRFVGTDFLGLYVIASKLPDFAKVITHTPISQVSLPALSRLQNDHPRMRIAVCKAMELNALVSFAVFVGIAAVATDLVPLLFGDKWAGAAQPCAMLSIYALITTLTVFIHPILLASGGTGKYLFLNLCQSIGALIGCIVGIRFGIAYLILGLIINNLIITVPALLFIRHRIGLSALEYCRPCVVPALASLFMAAMVWLLDYMLPEGIMPLAAFTIKTTVAACAYLGFLLAFKRTILIKLFDIIGHALGGKV